MVTICFTTYHEAGAIDAKGGGVLHNAARGVPVNAKGRHAGRVKGKVTTYARVRHCQVWEAPRKIEKALDLVYCVAYRVAGGVHPAADRVQDIAKAAPGHVVYSVVGALVILADRRHIGRYHAAHAAAVAAVRLLDRCQALLGVALHILQGGCHCLLDALQFLLGISAHALELVSHSLLDVLPGFRGFLFCLVPFRADCLADFLHFCGAAVLRL